MKALRWVGLTLQVAGVVIAATGLWLTWREYGRDRAFWGPIVRLFRRGWTWTKERGTRLWVKLGGRRPATHHTVVGSLSSTWSISGSARAAWTPPPDIENDPAGFAQEIARRADELHETVQAQRAALSRGKGALNRRRIAPIECCDCRKYERANDPRRRGRRHRARSVRGVPCRGRHRAPGDRPGSQSVLSAQSSISEPADRTR